MSLGQFQDILSNQAGNTTMPWPASGVQPEKALISRMLISSMLPDGPASRIVLNQWITVYTSLPSDKIPPNAIYYSSILGMDFSNLASINISLITVKGDLVDGDTLSLSLSTTTSRQTVTKALTTYPMTLSFNMSDYTSIDLTNVNYVQFILRTTPKVIIFGSIDGKLPPIYSLLK